jgi:parallel beta-helix repeat protein
MHIRTTAVTALVFGCTLFALLSITGVAQPGTLTVGPGGQFSGIQAAVNAASPGDTIVVYSGTYRENVDVNKRLNLIGEDTGEGKPVVDAGMAGNALLLTADGVHVFGLALTGSSYKNAGIKAVSSNNLIEDCDLYDNYNGIYLFHSSDNVVISNCAYGNSYDGINLNYSCNNRILNNDLSGNAHDGLRIEEYSHGNLVEGNNVTDNARSSVETESKNAITVYMSDGNVVQGNVMKGNGGIVVRESGTYRLGDGVMAMDTRGTIVRNNTMEDNHYAVWIYHSADATVAGNVAAGHYYCVVVEDSSR